MFIGKETFFMTELHNASENKRIMLPINKQDAKCNCCLEDLKIIRDKIGTAMPIKAMGPKGCGKAG